VSSTTNTLFSLLLLFCRFPFSLVFLFLQTANFFCFFQTLWFSSQILRPAGIQTFFWLELRLIESKDFSLFLENTELFWDKQRVSSSNNFLFPLRFFFFFLFVCKPKILILSTKNRLQFFLYFISKIISTHLLKAKEWTEENSCSTSLQFQHHCKCSF